jgi:hypothetical protein
MVPHAGSREDVHRNPRWLLDLFCSSDQPVPAQAKDALRVHDPIGLDFICQINSVDYSASRPPGQSTTRRYKNRCKTPVDSGSSWRSPSTGRTEWIITGQGQDAIGDANRAEAALNRCVVLMADRDTAEACVGKRCSVVLDRGHLHHLSEQILSLLGVKRCFSFITRRFEIIR